MTIFERIKKLANKYPNSGQLKKALSEFNKERITKITSKPNDLLPLIGILVDIMIHNPGSLPQCVLIIGQLLKFENKSKAREIVEMIVNKYALKPNTEFMMIWFQRLTTIFGETSNEVLSSDFVSKIKDPISTQMFSIDWLNEDIKESFYEGTIKDENKYNKMSKKIYIAEFDDFNEYHF